MRPPLEIPVRTAEGLERRDTLYRTARRVRLRTRARIVLLAGEQRLAAPAIARLVRGGEQAVRRWLKRDRAEGIAGPTGRPTPGAPGKVTPAYREPLLAAVRRRPRSLGQPHSLWRLQRLAGYLAEQAGLRLSCETVRPAPAAAETVLSRPRHTGSSPDPEAAAKRRRLEQSAMSCRPATRSIMPTRSIRAGGPPCARRAAPRVSG